MTLKLYNLFSFESIKTTLCVIRIVEAQNTCTSCSIKRNCGIFVQSVYGFDVANDVDPFSFGCMECSVNLLPFSQAEMYKCFSFWDTAEYERNLFVYFHLSVIWILFGALHLHRANENDKSSISLKTHVGWVSWLSP